MTDDELGETFGKYGEVTEVQQQYSAQTGEPKGYAHIQFRNIESATRALEAMQGALVGGQKIVLDYARERRYDLVGEMLGSTNRLFLGNLPPGTTQYTLREALPPLESAVDIRIRPPGIYAHVGFPDVQSAEAAHEAIQGMKIDGRTVRLDYAVRLAPEQGSQDTGEVKQYRRTSIKHFFRYNLTSTVFPQDV